MKISENLEDIDERLTLVLVPGNIVVGNTEPLRLSVDTLKECLQCLFFVNFSPIAKECYILIADTVLVDMKQLFIRAALDCLLRN